MLTNTRTAFGWLAILLHWISAVGVIWLYFSGEDIEHAKKDGLARNEIVAMTDFHQSLGLLFLLFLAAFVIQHFVQKRPEPIPQHRYLALLSIFVQRLWLLLIAVQVITGPLLRWSAARPNTVFDWFSIPSPFPERVDWLHESLEWVHATAPNLFWPLLVLHVAGALKHLVIDRDATVQRMIYPKADQAAAARSDNQV
jgi:cytochrome b561